ncbi:MAG: hypothetical protein RI957_2058 [Verrucomicrobiota bacterium]|jgi:hypothetical protein
MQRSFAKLLLPLLLLISLAILVWHSGADQESTKEPTAEAPTIDASRLLVQPFWAKRNLAALALDGGNIPVAQGQVPSVVIGKNIMRTLHLAWVHDWSHPACRSVFHKLQALYASEQAEALPALKIYLNPVSSDPAGEALHRAMLQVYFRSRIRENYLILASELSSGLLSADAEAVRERVVLLDPTLMADWNTPLEWLESDVNHTFSVAAVQMARNEQILGEKIPAQLSAMLTILPTTANDQEIIAFLQDAESRQRAWLKVLVPSTIMHADSKE